MANLQIVISALNKASGEINKVKSEIKSVGDTGKTAEGGVKRFDSSLLGVIGTAGMVAAAVGAVSLAIKEVYKIAKEGAQLEYVRTKFDNLAESIGIVSDALLIDLREATRGTVSDAELIAGAANFMSLGLADTHDEVVRLTRVAGALGMNMNQLVLTLTNKTTMRFDQLNVAVEGFDEKVKALEATGMGVQEAFTEAFLQQAEEQIQRVGDIADTSAGSFERLEASAKNLSDNLKTKLAPAVALVADGLADMLDNANDIVEGNPLYNIVDAVDALTLAFYNGTITETEYNTLLTQIHQGYITSAEAVAMVTPEIEAVTQAQYDSLDSIFMASVSWEDFQAKMAAAGLDLGLIDEELYNSEKANYAVADAAKQAAADTALASGNYEEYGKILGLTEEQLKAVTAEQERLAKIQEEISKVTSLTGYFSDMVSLGENFTDILAEITKQEQIMAENPIGSKKYEEAKGKVEELKVAMQDLANQVVLDMMMSTIAIGGVTQAEADAYFQLAADMGTISQEAAEAAKTAYGDAIEYINSLEIDDKTGNIVFKVDDTEVRNYRPPTVRGTVAYIPAYATTQAVGGAVQGGAPYTWQEYGYRGELFVPSADGFIMSRADAERALSKALAGGASKESINADDIGRAIADALVRAGVNKSGNVYNLTMPTSSNPADVKTAFELMEAWA